MDLISDQSHMDCLNWIWITVCLQKGVKRIFKEKEKRRDRVEHKVRILNVWMMKVKARQLLDISIWKA